MKVLLYIGFCLAMLWPVKMVADDARSIRDIFTNQKVLYTSKYKELKNNPFNLYGEISADYPVLLEFPKANDKLYYYCVKYLESDSFKLEMLQRSRIASSIFLSRKSNSRDYAPEIYQNYEQYLPEINDVEYKFLFLYDGLLAVQLKYNYKINSPYKDYQENFTMYKQIFVSINDGKLYNLQDLFSISKQSDLKKMLQKKADDVFNANKKVIQQELEEDEDDDEDRAPTKNNKAQEIKLNELMLTINPFGVVFSIPELSYNSSNYYGVPLQLNFEPASIKQYLNPLGPLNKLINYKMQFGTDLKNVNLHRELNYSRWEQTYNIQQQNSPYTMAPAEGVQSLTQYIKYKNQHDSMLQKQRVLIFNTQGFLIEEDFYNDSKNVISGKTLYEYNEHKLLKTISRFNGLKNTSKMEMSYDVNYNLIKIVERDDDDGKKINNFFYLGNTIYETIEEGTADENSEIREYHVNDFGKLINFGEYGQDPNYETIYNKQLPLGSFSYKRPALDNSVYCYDDNGKLLTYQHDNGRHLYEFSYDKNGKCKQVLHIEYRTLKDSWKYTYNEQGLMKTCEMLDGIYNYNETNNVYHYKFDYSFY